MVRESRYEREFESNDAEFDRVVDDGTINSSQ